MKRFQKFLVAILMAALLAGPVSMPLAARSRTHTSQTHKKNARPKTVHVKSYKKKNGTVVKSHDRSAPQPR